MELEGFIVIPTASGWIGGTITSRQVQVFRWPRPPRLAHPWTAINRWGDASHTAAAGLARIFASRLDTFDPVVAWTAKV